MPNSMVHGNLKLIQNPTLNKTTPSPQRAHTHTHTHTHTITNTHPPHTHTRTRKLTKCIAFRVPDTPLESLQWPVAIQQCKQQTTDDIIFTYVCMHALQIPDIHY